MANANALTCRNIRIDGRRTSIRLEGTMWEALKEICESQGTSVHRFCENVDRGRETLSLTAAIRVAIVSHYRRRIALVEAGPSVNGAGVAAARHSRLRVGSATRVAG